MKKVILSGLLFASSLFAQAPMLECRFAAIEQDGSETLDEEVTYGVIPGAEVTGWFAPYEIDIFMDRNDVAISIYLDDEPINSLEIPVINILAMPVGASVFGVNTVHHVTIDDYVSMKYECIKIY